MTVLLHDTNRNYVPVVGLTDTSVNIKAHTKHVQEYKQRKILKAVQFSLQFFKFFSSFYYTIGPLTLILLMRRIRRAHNNARKWQTGLNSEFKAFKVKQSRYRPEVPRGFQEVKVSRLRGNGPEWW